MRPLISLLSIMFSFSLLAEVQTTTNKETRIRVIEKAEGLPDGEVSYLKRISSIPTGSVVLVDDQMRLTKPLFGDDVASVKRSRGIYLGPIRIVQAPGLNNSEIAELNQKNIYIYRYDVDLAPLLQSKWDWDIPSNMSVYDEDVEWNKVSTKGFWTAYTMEMLEQYGKMLIKKTPQDVTSFCPKYFDLNLEEKKLFWVHLFSSIAKRESAFDSDVTNDESQFSPGLNAISRGLLQISFSSSQNRNYKKKGCSAKVASDLTSPIHNLRCGVAIMEHLAADGCISCKKGKDYLGIARYWSTLREPYTLPCASCSGGVANVGKKLEIIEELKKIERCY